MSLSNGYRENFSGGKTAGSLSQTSVFYAEVKNAVFEEESSNETEGER